MIQKRCLACGTIYEPSAVKCAKDGCGNGLVVVLPDLIGQKIGSWYTITERLGQGGMGAIYKAHHGLMDRFVAIKLLLTEAGSDPGAIARFQVEARAASILSHPNIVKIFEFDLTPDGLPFLIMEYLEGYTLQQLIDTRGRIAVERAVPKFIELCSALDHAHKRNVVHRDLKPSNIMLIPDDDGAERIMIVDFGIAKLFAQPGRNELRLTQTGEIFGSPLYMSPEQCMGQPVTARSDIYALGCVMYEALTGTPPITGNNFLALVYAHVNVAPLPFAQVCPDIALPPQLESIVMRTLKKSADDRYSSMSELRKDLQEFLQAQTAAKSAQPAGEQAEHSGSQSGTPPAWASRVPLPAVEPESDSPTENSKFDELIKSAESGNAEAQHELGYFYYTGQFVDQDYDLAMYWLKKAADANQVIACYWVGTMYRDGLGVEENPQQALHYYQKAAELGDDVSMSMVAFFYELGEGTEKDLDLAFYWYRKAADQNNLLGIKALARFYTQGLVVDVDLEKAAEYTLKAADAGDADAQIDAGLLFMDGKGVKEDAEEAATWYLAAAQQASVRGKRLLAYCYLDGTGVPKDDREAFRWMKEAATASDPEAQSYIAYFYEEGIGGVNADQEMAFKWYSKAALKKHAESQYRLGLMSLNGRGTTRNAAQAVSWFERAAEQGMKKAQFDLAICYRDGTGIEKNIDEYEVWLKLAADQGLPEAEYEMGRHCEEDLKDVPRARQWYQKAADQGNQAAKTRLLQLGFVT